MAELQAGAEIKAGEGFILRLRVYYADTDAGGIVYHARYLDFAERCRTELLRAVGYPLVSAEGYQFVVRRAQIDWQAPARLEELLTCKTLVTSASGARLTMRHSLFNEDGRFLTGIDVELAHVSAQHRPVRLPQALLDAIAGVRQATDSGDATSR